MSVAANEEDPARSDARDENAPRPLFGAPRKGKLVLHGVEVEDFQGHMIDDATRALGIMKVSDVDPEKSHYLGASHWVAVGLKEISEFRTYLRDNHKELESEALIKHQIQAMAPVNTLSLLKGAAPPISKEEVLSWVPPRIIADELLLRYFESDHPSCILVHKPTFLNDYAAFWLEPSKTTFHWLALFFSMMRVSEVMRESSDLESDPKPDYLDLVTLYKRLTIQCLIAADFTNPTINTLRALLLYLESEWLTSQDSSIEISLVLGLGVRLAMSMGIHREFKSHADLTPFQAEMRRRLWSSFHCMDIMYSFQLSLPPTVRQEDCDCALPKNIRNEDFSKDSKELPPPRPSTEITEVSYMVIKRQLVYVLDKVLKATEQNGEISRDEIRKLEELMLASRNAVPPHLSMTFAGNTSAVSPQIRRQRIGLDRIALLSQCMLYRKFLAKAHQEEKQMHYRRSCIDAAVRLLGYQAESYSLSGAEIGRPISIHKRHIYTLSSHDFFAAGMAIAVDLIYGIRFEPQAPKASDIRLWGFDRRPEMVEALEKSIGFWGIAKSDSVEAAKAWGLFSYTVKKVKETLDSGSSPEVSDEVITSYSTADVDRNASLSDDSEQASLQFDWVSDN